MRSRFVATYREFVAEAKLDEAQEKEVRRALADAQLRAWMARGMPMQDGDLKDVGPYISALKEAEADIARDLEAKLARLLTPEQQRALALYPVFTSIPSLAVGLLDVRRRN